MKPKKWKNKNFITALKRSLHGIYDTFQNETNLKIQLVCAILAIGLALIFKLTYLEWLVLCLTIGMVLFAEIMNTAIELVLDVYSEHYHEKIKRAKDVASGAVLVTSITAVVIGCILFLPKIWNIK